MGLTDSIAGSVPGNPITTPAEFDRLLAELRAADAAVEAADGTPAYAEAVERDRRAFEAVLAARPNDPVTMGRQLRWFVEQELVQPEHAPVFAHIADRLEALARG